ncbi:hypothetical protein [Streptomyces sp. 900105755]
MGNHGRAHLRADIEHLVQHVPLERREQRGVTALSSTAGQATWVSR